VRLLSDWLREDSSAPHHGRRDRSAASAPTKLVVRVSPRLQCVCRTDLLPVRESQHSQTACQPEARGQPAMNRPHRRMSRLLRGSYCRGRGASRHHGPCVAAENDNGGNGFPPSWRLPRLIGFHEEGRIEPAKGSRRPSLWPVQGMLRRRARRPLRHTRFGIGSGLQPKSNGMFE
jgi:hypothetical protein